MNRRSRSRYSYFPPYVPVAERKKEAIRLVKKLQKKGEILNPVTVEGRLIAQTFWGKAWCQNLESYSDIENRLSRGRSYLRTGSVIDLAIKAGEVTAQVSGAYIYDVKIMITPVSPSRWQAIVDHCSGKIESLIELLQGKFSKGIMEIIVHPTIGLFPHPKEIQLSCSCPDYATMCKHVAAVLYGIGVRLDARPEDLFLLRQANHMALIETAALSKLGQEPETSALDEDLSSLFGIDIAGTPKNLPQK